MRGSALWAGAASRPPIPLWPVKRHAPQYPPAGDKTGAHHHHELRYVDHELTSVWAIPARSPLAISMAAGRQ